MSSLITVREAANRLSLSESKVYRMTLSGEIYSKRIGRAVRIPEEIIQRLVNIPSSGNQVTLNGEKP